MALPLPKRYHVDFRLPLKKPLSPVELDPTKFLGANTLYIPFNETAGLPRSMGASLQMNEVGSVPINIQDGNRVRTFSTNNYLTIDNATAKAIRPTKPFTVFARVRRTGTLVDFSGIFCGSTFANGNTWVMLGNVNNSVTWAIEDSGGFKVLTRTVALPIDEWATIIGTWDGANIHLYVDGILDSSTACGTPDYNASPSQLASVGIYPNGDAINRKEWQGNIEYCGITDKYWDQGLVTAFTRSQYDILKPKTPPIFFPSADAGISVTPNPVNTAQTISEPTLTQANIFAVDDLSSGNTISEPALTQAHVLSVDNVSTGHTLSEVTLAIAATLLVDDLSNAQTISNIALIEHNLLVVDPITTDQTISNVTLTPEGVLAVNSLVTNQAISEPSLTAHLSLIVDDITNNQFISVVNFDDEQEIGTVTAAFKANEIGVEYGLLEFTVRFKE